MEVTYRKRIVLIGHGHWGKNVARNLNELDSLYGIFDPVEATRQHVAELYPAARIFTTFEAVLADELVDGVAICAPAELHAPLAIRAFEAGLDAFVEKPLALTFEDGARMTKSASEHGQILMVGHLLEYHPAVLKLEELVRTGELGRLQYLYSNRLNLGKFRSEENILWSFAPHDISVILRLIGERPIEVLTTGGAYLQPNVQDTTVTNMQFANGVRAHIFVSWLHPYKEQKLVVVGSEKMALFDDRAPAGEKLMLYDKGASWNGRTPVPRQGGGVPVDFPATEPLRAEIDHFITCVETRQRPNTDGANGQRVLQVLQAAQRSLMTGGNRVAINEPVFAG